MIVELPMSVWCNFLHSMDSGGLIDFEQCRTALHDEYGITSWRALPKNKVNDTVSIQLTDDNNLALFLLKFSYE